LNMTNTANTRKQKMTRPAPRKALAEIAQTLLGIETLEARKSDRLDFYEIAVWKLEAALAAAYEAGRASA